MTKRILIPVILAGLVGAPTVAFAQDDPAEMAKENFEKGEVAYREGNFKKALMHYKEAQKYKRHPALIFNIAQCHRQLNNYKRSLFFYKLFLSEKPDASNKKEVMKFIDELTEKKRKQDLLLKGSKPFYKRWWFLAGVVTAGLMGIGASITGGLAISKNNSFKKTHLDADRKSGQTMALTTDILIGTGAAIAIAVTVGAIITAKGSKKEKAETKDDKKASFTPACGASGCGVWVTGRF